MSHSESRANESDRRKAVTVTTTCIDWYAEGESRVVAVDGVEIAIRFVGRKGRRGRIAITAPAGAVYQS